jgi:NADPH:quinone reductase-like Zn-dependent oxidoreductase
VSSSRRILMYVFWLKDHVARLLSNVAVQILGMDIAGTVVAVGAKVTTYKAGDRVAAIAPGAITGNQAGAGFQLYTIVPEGFAARIPDNLPFTNAVVLPLALATAASGLFELQYLGIDVPAVTPSTTMVNQNKAILVWGGSSSVGSCAIQLCTATGLTVFATASSKNFEYVKNLGASHVFDYKDPDVVTKLVQATHGKTIVGVYDSISSNATILACAQFLQAFGGGKVYGTVSDAGALELPEGVKRVSGSPPHSAVDGGPAVWHRVWADFIRKGLENGRLRAKPEPIVLEGGLQRLQEGIDMCREGVSAQKVVIELVK